MGRWLKLTKDEIKYAKPGRKHGAGRRLTREQEQRIKRLITDKTPDQLKLAYALWTRESVRELIRSEYKIVLPIRTTGDYLKRWGMTPQKPQKRAYEQRAPAVKKWLDEE
ncbi:MAG TPA: winged helix-turn-helix domain-containing protein [Cellvibrionaceae bacterium]|nr:winged helix-turn-helix domain-containing protein [Cellvibrionaceae bacterium]